jgi:hypothetical protein
MVVLVRCCDGSCSLAMKSHLDDLINAGLISAFLHDGVWVKTGHSPAKREYPASRRPKKRLVALVSSF